MALDPNAPQPTDPPTPLPPPAAGASMPTDGAQPPAAPQPTAQQANIAHSALMGHGFKSIMSAMGGTTTQYQQTPNGPQPVQVKNSAGDFFRSILAGAIMGGAAGAANNDGSGAGYGGAGRGVQAVQANAQQQQVERQKQAQLQFQNKLTADKARQEATGFETEQQVRKAQIAQANAETLKTNLLTAGTSYDMHKKVADDDSARISTYTQAGLKPKFEDIPESQMQDIIKNSPGASTLDWRHSGVTTVVGADGTPHYEYKLSAYDPQQPLPLSKGTVDQWEKDGLFKYHPEYKDIAVPGKTLTVGQFTSLDKQAQGFYGQTLAKSKDDQEAKLTQARIDEAKSAMNEHFTQSRLANLGIQEKQIALNDKKAIDTAYAHLSAVGNDPDQLTDSHDKIALAKAAAPAMAETLAAIKDAQANINDPEAQKSLPDLWGRYNSLTKLASLAHGVQPATVAPSGSPAALVANKLIGPAPSGTVAEALQKLDAVPSINVDPVQGISDAVRAQTEAEIRSRYAASEKTEKARSAEESARKSKHNEEFGNLYLPSN